MPMIVTIDRPGKSHILTRSWSGEVRRRRMTCEMQMSR